ncbi:MAG TPA: SRPBCC family protein [Ktedonobacterales bacterium]|nr:SRPBCC family protein [Ktedonobacterales bacterium]
MREGTGEATVVAAPEVAFAYLADPRNARQWFAGAALAEQPEGAPHAGLRWRFVQARGKRVVPVRMEVYEPPSRFVWRTALRWPRTNLRWEMRCEPTGERAGGTRLRMTIGIEPGPMGWLALWLAKPAFRPDPAMQAQRAVERARDALEEQAVSRTDERRKAPEKRKQRRR